MNAYEFLLKKGIKKVHQPTKSYNFSVQELVDFLEEFANDRKSSIRKLYAGKDPLKLTGQDEG